MSSPSGQLSPDDRKRSTTARTVDAAIPIRRAISRPATSPENVSRRISRTWRIGTLSAGIRHLPWTVPKEATLRGQQGGRMHPPAERQRGGRHHFGTLGDIISERRATSFRKGG